MPNLNSLDVLRFQQRRRVLAEVGSQIIHVARQHRMGMVVAGIPDRLKKPEGSIASNF